MRPWIEATAVSVVLLSWALVSQAEDPKAVYLWQDRSGKTHLTQEPPQAEGFIQQRITSAPVPPPENRLSGSAAPAEDRSNNAFERCRLAEEAQQLALTVRREANDLQRRAEESRYKSKILKNRAGFDDDRLDNFKYDIQRLEEKAQWYDALARQADVHADSADLQSHMAQLISGGRCP